MWIGIDDTDSAHGGCTTYVATEIIRELSSEYDIIGYPRLVRLNPNIPWKTRGNGAVAIHLGRGYGKKRLIGNIEERVYAYSSGKEIWNEDLVKKIDEIIKKHAHFYDEKTNPAFVVCRNKPSYSFYKKAVRKVVSIDEAIKNAENCIYRMYKEGRGIIGSVASCSWRPYDRTYELIAYGNEKWVDEDSVIKMDKKIASTFDNYDYENRHVQIVPNAPSPVMYGIRGDVAEELIKAMNMIKSAEVERWLIFETNQATDDHLVRKSIRDIEPFESVIVRGTVSREPRTIKGGHVVFSIYDGDEIDCTAYEPTKGFRNIVRELRKGDIVTIYGGVRKEPRTINIEKIKIEKLVDVYEKVENPVCPRCNKHMKSMGKGRGYRCVICGMKVGEEMALRRKIKRNIEERFYEVPVVARRHLSKPLKRM
ncbi:MAG: DUF1743 domain-containing protein [Thermoplasmata archaeon]|nr:DUF1743 domain-containing protein [Thermoplasmata archaeon]